MHPSLPDTGHFRILSLIYCDVWPLVDIWFSLFSPFHLIVMLADIFHKRAKPWLKKWWHQRKKKSKRCRTFSKIQHLELLRVIEFRLCSQENFLKCDHLLCLYDNRYLWRLQAECFLSSFCWWTFCGIRPMGRRKSQSLESRELDFSPSLPT